VHCLALWCTGPTRSLGECRDTRPSTNDLTVVDARRWLQHANHIITMHQITGPPKFATVTLDPYWPRCAKTGWRFVARIITVGCRAKCLPNHLLAELYAHHYRTLSEHAARTQDISRLTSLVCIPARPRSCSTTFPNTNEVAIDGSLDSNLKE
jgi:hypothetical protein